MGRWTLYNTTVEGMEDLQNGELIGFFEDDAIHGYVETYFPTMDLAYI